MSAGVVFPESGLYLVKVDERTQRATWVAVYPEILNIEMPIVDAVGLGLVPALGALRDRIARNKSTTAVVHAEAEVQPVQPR